MAYAQVAGVTRSGSITAPSSAALVQLQVSIKNVATEVTRIVTSDSAGFYTAPNLVPGEYRVTVVARGFVPSVADVTLTVGANQSLDMPMKVGGCSETVEVKTEAPAGQLSPSAIRALVNR